MAGFGDQRQLELLVEGGLTPEKAIQVATSNGALFLNEQDSIGTIAIGKHADLVIVRGNPSDSITDIRNVEAVMKKGVLYAPSSFFLSDAEALLLYGDLATSLLASLALVSNCSSISTRHNESP